QPVTVGRYLLHRKIARGGMATIHIARLMGDVGFSRIVAAKRMHPELAEDREFVSMFLDEARIASKVHHRNVVPVLDVVTYGEEVVLVQEYVHGAPLSLLLRAACEAKAHVPIPVAAALACQVLAGLHAAHETLDEIGTPLNIVHRDVSPQNIMVATDGSARLLDFGVAKASLGAHVTRKGTFKGKLGYSSPEQIRGEANRQSDIYSLGVVLWELLVGHRLHGNTHGEAQLIAQIMGGHLPTVTEALDEEKSWIGSYRWGQLECLEPIIRKALDVNYRRRWQSAAEMEEVIAAAVPLASAADIAAWLRAVGKDFLEARENMIAEEEASWRRTLANTEEAVKLPTEAVPVIVPIQQSTGVATEPEGLRPITHTLLQRGPTAVIAGIIVVLSLMVAFFMRDLEKTKAPASPPAAAYEPPQPQRPAAAAITHSATQRAAPTPSPARASVTPVAADPPRAPSDVRGVSMELPDEREELLEDQPSNEKTVDRPRSVSQKRTATNKPPARPKPAVRPAPTRPTAPAHTPAPSPPTKSTATVDCSTPFYFEGSKKIFKPGCL
ncbi:MAG TPA: protein kinase, partial [Kofleriaceae bacterium]|nr:protein kinase [Kofleriaceae bacterium]